MLTFAFSLQSRAYIQQNQSPFGFSQKDLQLFICWLYQVIKHFYVSLQTSRASKFGTAELPINGGSFIRSAGILQVRNILNRMDTCCLSHSLCDLVWDSVLTYRAFLAARRWPGVQSQNSIANKSRWQCTGESSEG